MRGVDGPLVSNRIAKHNVLAREDVATLMDLREALATVVTAEDETPLLPRTVNGTGHCIAAAFMSESRSRSRSDFPSQVVCLCIIR